jgi:DnaJ-domain-containing protein 1
VFERFERFIADVDACSTTATTLVAAQWAPEDDQVGAAMIAFASDRVPTFIVASYGSRVLPRHREVARHAVARLFFSDTANHYQLLGLNRTTDAERIRKNYQRLMALVHPDAGAIDFPRDAASRVNRAYATLSDAQLRAQYDASISMNLISQNVPASTRRVTVQAHEDTSFLLHLRRWIPNLGFRRGVVLALLASAFCAALALFALIPTDTLPVLVESRPRLVLAESLAPKVDPATSDAASRSAELAQSIAAQSTNAATSLPRPVSETKPADVERSPLRLTMQLETPRETARQSTIATPPTSLSPQPAAPPKSVSVTNEPGLVRGDASISVSSKLIAKHEAQDSKHAVVSERVTGPAPANPLINDVAVILAQFTSSYESGSLASLASTFSPDMVARESVLTEYEKVFQQTKQRSIRLSDVRHTHVGDSRLVSAGVATVTTTDLRDRQVRQRVFLEIEIAREDNVSRIVRLANYEQK